MIIYIYRDDIFYQESSDTSLKVAPLSHLKKFNKAMISGIIIFEDQPASLFVANDKKEIEQKIKQLKNKFLIATLDQQGLYYCATIRKNKLYDYKLKVGKFNLLAIYPVNLLMTDKVQDGVLVCNIDDQKVRLDYYEKQKMVYSQVTNEDQLPQIEIYLRQNNIILNAKQRIFPYDNQTAKQFLTANYESYCQLLVESSKKVPANSSFIGLNSISTKKKIRNRYLFLLILILVVSSLTFVKYWHYHKLTAKFKINKTIWQQIENEYHRVKTVETDLDSFNSIISNNIMFFKRMFPRNYPFNGAVITRAFYHRQKNVMEIQGYTAQYFDSFMNSLNSQFENVQLISSYYQRDVNLFKIMIYLGKNND